MFSHCISAGQQLSVPLAGCRESCSHCACLRQQMRLPCGCLPMGPLCSHCAHPRQQMRLPCGCLQLRGAPRSNAAAKDSDWVHQRQALEKDKAPDVNEVHPPADSAGQPDGLALPALQHCSKCRDACVVMHLVDRQLSMGCGQLLLDHGDACLLTFEGVASLA